ncbi:hypothetical protein AB0K18_42565 [Nonomuraea sp. NPDC049421]|uniref:hypothetical protein n=1 Tax=Nonomuraea sp. NPDC049421 TaxID=3155275 RepID=UPI0034194674
MSPLPPISRYDRVQLADGTLGIAWRVSDTSGTVWVNPDNHQKPLIEAPREQVTRLFGPGEPVILKRGASPQTGISELRVVARYTSNGCYRLVETTYYTGCDHDAEDIQPLPAEGYGYNVKSTRKERGNYYVPGKRCYDCDRTIDPMRRDGVPCVNAFWHARNVLDNCGRGWIEAVPIAELPDDIKATLMEVPQ